MLWKQGKKYIPNFYKAMERVDEGLFPKAPSISSLKES